jgi:hypothetical protein
MTYIPPIRRGSHTYLIFEGDHIHTSYSKGITYIPHIRRGSHTYLIFEGDHGISGSKRNPGDPHNNGAKFVRVDDNKRLVEDGIQHKQVERISATPVPMLQRYA